MSERLPSEEPKIPAQALRALSAEKPMALPFSAPRLHPEYAYMHDGRRDIVPTMVGEYGRLSKEMLDSID